MHKILTNKMFQVRYGSIIDFQFNIANIKNGWRKIEVVI